VTLHAAFAQADITPPPGLRLAGMPDAPVATGTHLPLRGRVALFDDGARRVALVSVDVSGLEATTVAGWREQLASAGGLEPGDIMICCTHTHRAPHAKPAGEVDRDEGFLDFALERLCDALAAATLRPARLRVGRQMAPGWAFNRRPLYRDGRVATQGPAWVPEFERFEGEVDEWVQTVVAIADDDAVLGGLVSFACHPTAVSSDPLYSPDYPGALCEALGGVVLFALGACGDVSPRDLSTPGAARSGIAHAERMGRALADAARTSCAVEGARVRAGSEWLEIPQRRPTPEQVRLARAYLEEAEAADELELTGFYANDPLVQRWLARELIGMWEWQRRSGARVPADRVEIQVVAVGELAFVGYPAEMFAAWGVDTRERSPFATTIVCTLANGAFGYVPTPEAFDHGGYETRLAFTSRLVPEAGERMTNAALRVLGSMRAG
jgi:hypothetical protein